MQKASKAHSEPCLDGPLSPPVVPPQVVPRRKFTVPEQDVFDAMQEDELAAFHYDPDIPAAIKGKK